MIKRLTLWAASLFFGAAVFAQSVPAGLEGKWLGTLNVGIELRLVFNIDIDGDSLSSTLDSPDQSTYGIPTGSTTYANGTITVDMPMMNAQYAGKYSADSNMITGVWIQGAPMPLTLRRVDSVAKKIRPQDPLPPLPYYSEEVTFANKKAKGVTLAGTLTVPKGSGPFPAVILISGSGPQDRNEELLGHKPFLVLSDHLTRHGIIVLRYDDRGYGASTGDHSTATSADFATDANAAMKYLMSRKDLNISVAGFAGHSEGGVIAPMAAAKNKQADFLVLLAGTGIPGDSLLMLQGELIGRASGMTDSTLKYAGILRRNLMDLVMAYPDTAELRKAVIDFNRSFLQTTPPDVLNALQMTPADTAYGYDAFSGPWMRYFMSYDPAPVLTKTRIPVLALNGKKDLQVPWQENLSAIEAALKTAGNTRYRIEAPENLNHLFQNCATGSPFEYSSIDETFDPATMQLISDWIRSLQEQ